MSISLDVVIPCLNEERALPVCIRRLHAFMSEQMGRYDWGIVVADNGSTDGTLDAAEALSQEFPQVRYIRLGAARSGSRPAPGLDREPRRRRGLHGR